MIGNVIFKAQSCFKTAVSFHLVEKTILSKKSESVFFMAARMMGAKQGKNR